jgi:hypothetical protein
MSAHSADRTSPLLCFTLQSYWRRTTGCAFDYNTSDSRVFYYDQIGDVHNSMSRVTTKSEMSVIAACLWCPFGKTKKLDKTVSSRRHWAPPACHRWGGGHRHWPPMCRLDGHLALSAFIHFTPPTLATVSKGRHPAVCSLRMASWRRGRRRGAYRYAEASTYF